MTHPSTDRTSGPATRSPTDPPSDPRAPTRADPGRGTAQGATALGPAADEPPHPRHLLGNALRAIRVFGGAAFNVVILGDTGEPPDVTDGTRPDGPGRPPPEDLRTRRPPASRAVSRAVSRAAFGTARPGDAQSRPAAPGRSGPGPSGSAASPEPGPSAPATPSTSTSWASTIR